MKVGEIARNSAVAWAPSSSVTPASASSQASASYPVIALGTVSGAIDSSFSTTTELELYEFNPSSSSSSSHPSSSRALEQAFGRKLGAVTANARFNRLSWGLTPDNSRPFGVLAGGLENGELVIWDPKAILSSPPVNATASASTDPTIIMRNRNHKGPVRGLDFNPVDTKFLASGATEGEISIWDLNNLSKSYSPGNRSQRLEDVTALAWNRQVFYILASASNNGSTVVWDLRNRKEIICLAHPAGRRPISSMAWHPDNPTQLITASDDDSSPGLLMWDLRNARAPEKTLHGHSKGVLSVSWCPKDSDLLVSCGRDNRTIVWNVPSGTAIGDMHYTNNWSFDTQWCGKNPDLVCVASYDGTVSVHSMQATEEIVSSSAANGVDSVSGGFAGFASTASPANDDPFNISNFEQPSQSVKFTLPHAPKWIRRPSGVSWGFGGRLVSFSAPIAQKDGGSGQMQQQQFVVTIRPIVSEPAFVVRARDLESVKTDAASAAVSTAGALPTPAASSLAITFCQKISASTEASVSERDREIWKFIGVLFETGAREHILKFLGFDKEDVGGSARLAEVLGRLRLASEPAMTGPAKANPAAAGGDGDSGGDDVFASVATANLAALSLPPATPFKLFPVGSGSAKGSSEDNDVDTLMMRSLILGDFETAVRVALGANRLSDALMFAVCGGNDLLTFVQAEYFRRTRDVKAYSRVLESVLSGDLRDVVENARIDGSGEGGSEWKDVLAIVCTYSKNEDMNELLGILGKRLEGLAAAASSSASTSFAKAGASGGATAAAEWRSKEEKKFAAVLCYLGAGDLRKVVDIWVVRESEEEKMLRRSLGESGKMGKGAAAAGVSRHTAKLLALQGLVEKVQLFRQAISYTDPDLVSGGSGTDDASAAQSSFNLEVLYQHYYRYAESAANQGLIDTAWRMLQLIPLSYRYSSGSSNNDAVAVLRDRVFRSGLVPVDFSQQPEFPFEWGNVAAEPLQPPQEHQQQHHPHQQQNQFHYYPVAPVSQPYQPVAPSAGYHGANGYGGAVGFAGVTASLVSSYDATTNGYSNSSPAYGGYNPTSTYPAQQNIQATPPPMMNSGSGSHNPRSTQSWSASDQTSGWNDPPSTFVPREAKKTNVVNSPFPFSPGSSSADLGAMGGATPPPPPSMGTATAPVLPPQPVRGMSNSGTAYPAPISASAGGNGYQGRPGYPATPPSAVAAAVPPAVNASVAAPLPPAAPARHPMGDRSHIPSSQIPMVKSLDKLLAACKELKTNPLQRREHEDTEKKTMIFIDQLNNAEVPEDVVSKMVAIVKALDTQDYATASKLQLELQTTRQSVVSQWIVGIKRIISSLDLHRTQQQQQQQQHQPPYPSQQHPHVHNSIQPPPPSGGYAGGPPSGIVGMPLPPPASGLNGHPHIPPPPISSSLPHPPPPQARSAAMPPPTGMMSPPPPLAASLSASGMVPTLPPPSPQRLQQKLPPPPQGAAAPPPFGGMQPPQQMPPHRGQTGGGYVMPPPSQQQYQQSQPQLQQQQPQYQQQQPQQQQHQQQQQQYQQQQQPVRQGPAGGYGMPPPPMGGAPQWRG